MIRVLLLFLVPLASGLTWDRLDKIRDLYGHDGIDTATVHITYPHSTELRRLTKREAAQNLLSRRHSNFTVKVTLKNSDRILDLELEPSRLQFHGALVTVLTGEGSEKYQVQDEKCHYQGFLDGRKGLASVHFCDGVLVGGADNGKMEYYFHSHRHPLPDDNDDVDEEEDNDDDDESEGSSDNNDDDDDEDLSVFDMAEPFHTIVSWKEFSGEHPAIQIWELSGDEKKDAEGEEKEEEKKMEKVKEMEEKEGEEERTGRVKRGSEGLGNPVVEMAAIFDQDFLYDHSYLYPTRRDLINLLMYKFTGVQAVYGSPGIGITIQMKLIYLWEKNPPEYLGSAWTMGMRLAAGRILSDMDETFAKADSAALYTSQAPATIVGMAFGGGICSRRGTFATRSYNLGWITECHELGHTMGIGHKDSQCLKYSWPWADGFMSSYYSKFLPCYKERLETTLRNKGCLFEQNLETYNIPAYRFQSNFPMQTFGMNHFCRVNFRPDAVYVPKERTPCEGILCAVMDERNTDYGMAQVSDDRDDSTFGRTCGEGKFCLNRYCKTLKGNTTVAAVNEVRGTGRWGRWTPYSQCSAPCGGGLLLSSRTCNKADRPEACIGYRYRAKLCNTQACPGDEGRTEKDLRVQRANVTCRALHQRGGRFSKYLQPWSSGITRRRFYAGVGMKSCTVQCEQVYRPYGLPRLQRRQFGRVLQQDGTTCGPPNYFDREVLGIDSRCVRGICMEFGCNGMSMDDRDGKINDLCGVCGGDNSTCTTGQKSFKLSNVTNTGDSSTGEMKNAMVVPAGSKDIMIAVLPDDNFLRQSSVKFIVVDKSNNVVLPLTKKKKPVNFAGTLLTSLDNEFLTVPGPLDQPMKIKVVNVELSEAQAYGVLVWSYKTA